MPMNMEAPLGHSTHDAEEDARNRDIKIYVDGALVPKDEAKVSVYDSGFMLGDGIWEGLRLHDGEWAFFDEHMDRLFSSLDKALEPGPCLLGERFSAIDVYLLMLVGWYDPPETLLERHANIARLCALVRERPAVKRLWDDYHPD